MNHPSDNPETCCPVCDGDGELSTDELEQLRADARALWSVRVLDAWAREQHTHHAIEPDEGGWRVFSLAGGHRCFGSGPTPDAARLAAALAVAPTLPADVRAKLGECP